MMRSMGHAGRYGAGGVAESVLSNRQQELETLSFILSIGDSKPTHFLQQGHTHSSKASLLIVSLPVIRIQALCWPALSSGRMYPGTTLSIPGSYSVRKREGSFQRQALPVSALSPSCCSSEGTGKTFPVSSLFSLCPSFFLFPSLPLSPFLLLTPYLSPNKTHLSSACMAYPVTR